MRLAMRLPAKKAGDTAANDLDPREGESAEIIDLASRNAFPAVTQRKGKSDGLGLAAGVAVIGLLGAITLWSMNSARTQKPDPSAAISTSGDSSGGSHAPSACSSCVTRAKIQEIGPGHASEASGVKSANVKQARP